MVEMRAAQASQPIDLVAQMAQHVDAVEPDPPKD
jgi:hypothetical protein